MQLYRKILLTIDCSEVDGPIVEHVSALARQNDASVVLMHVIHAHTLDQDRALREKADIAMEQLLSAMKEVGVTARSMIKSGEPEEVLLQEIENGDYDLVAMATHGHGFLGDLFFGSVSDSLKHKISVPLLLLRSEN